MPDRDKISLISLCEVSPCSSGGKISYLVVYAAKGAKSPMRSAQMMMLPTYADRLLLPRNELEAPTRA